MDQREAIIVTDSIFCCIQESVQCFGEFKHVQLCILSHDLSVLKGVIPNNHIGI